MDDRRVQILLEAIRRRREEMAEAKAKSTPASSKRSGQTTFLELLQKRQASEMTNPFRGPDKRYGGGQRKKKKKEKK